MGAIYQKDGQSVYDSNGVTYNAKTAAPIDPSNATYQSAPPISPVPTSTTSPVSLLSSATAAEGVQKQQQTLNTAVQNRAALTQNTTAAKPDETPVSLSSPDGTQDVTFTSPGINKDNIQSYLTQGWNATGGKLPDGMTGPNTTLPDPNDPSTKIDGIMEQMKGLLITDSDVASQVQGITQKYEALKSKMQQANNSRLAAEQQVGIRLGTSRYSPTTQSGIITEEMQQGVQRLAELDAQEQDTINKAKTAQRENNWTVFSKQMDYYDEIRKERDQKLSDQNKLLVQAQQKINDEARLGTITTSVAGLIKQGITDPKDLIDYINNHEDGSSTGANLTAPELKDMLDTFNVENPDIKNIGDIAQDAARQGAPRDILSAITAAGDTAGALQAAGDWLQNPSGIAGEYLYYKRQAEALGQTPVDFNEYQNIDANRKAKIAAAGSATGLNTQTLTKVQTIANGFDNEQIVKDYNTIASQVEFISGLGSTPTEDMARVYAFAKVMDPNSVVRESEYKSVQDYAQAVLQAQGLNVKRYFTSSGFLTDEARGFIKNTLTKRLQTQEKSYKNVTDEYGRRINKITGAKDGSEYLTDYSKGYQSTADLLTEQNSQDPLNLGMLAQPKSMNPLGI